MKIAFDVSALTTAHASQHKVRGSGVYIEQLKSALLRYFPDFSYTFFTTQNQLSDVDLVHIPYFEPFFRTIPLQKRFPTVVTVHDLTPLVFPSHFPPGIKGQVKWRIQKHVLKNMNAIITDSQASKKDIIRIVGIKEDKVHVVYLAPDKSFVRSKDAIEATRVRKKYDLPREFILYVGDVTWNKNLPRLIEAVKKINIPLVMVGKALVNKDFDSKNPWNQDLVRVGDLAYEDKRILRIGFVPLDELVILYNIARVFAMPSLYEGFGLPLLEAMACGCPVVTTKAGSLSEVASEGAYIVDAESVDSIADGIKHVFSNKKLQKELVERGFVQAKKFSWKKTATQTIDVYKSIIKV